MTRVKNQWELSTKPLRLATDTHTPQDGEFESISYSYTPREGVHMPHGYKVTCFPIKHAFKHNKTSTDCVVQTRTKMIGRANKNGWAVPSTSTKKGKQVARASKWIASQSHLM